MSEITSQLDQYRAGYERAQETFGGLIEPSLGQVEAITRGDGLDVLDSGEVDRAGFSSVDVDVRDYLAAREILGRVLLIENRATAVMNPAVIVPQPGKPGFVRIARLNMPYVPKIGLTDGLKLGVSFEAETQAPGFATHDTGDQQTASPFEPGHFGTGLTTGVSEVYAQALVQNGDKQTHVVVEAGLPQTFNGLGLVKGAPIPDVREIDTRQFKPGQRYPLHWHPSLETTNGAALASYPGGVELLIGAAVGHMTTEQLDRAAQYVTYAVAGAN